VQEAPHRFFFRQFHDFVLSRAPPRSKPKENRWLAQHHFATRLDARFIMVETKETHDEILVKQSQWYTKPKHGLTTVKASNGSNSRRNQDDKATIKKTATSEQ
jgi:hypothetical protein